jgi:hypothetical protein
LGIPKASATPRSPVLSDFTPAVERSRSWGRFARRLGCGAASRQAGRDCEGDRSRVRAELGLPISIGVARTKHLDENRVAGLKPDIGDCGTRHRARIPARLAG